MFKSPGSLAKLHKQIRKELKDSGVDVILESSERSREHLSNHEYARKADKERAEESKRIAAEREQLDKDKAELPRLRQQAFSEGRKQGRKVGEVEGYAEGFESGQVDVGARIAEAKQQAENIVAQAMASAEKLREERERLEQENEAKRSRSEALDAEIQGKQTTVQQVEDAITAKHNELQQVAAQVEAAESSRENMTQLDSDFLDYALDASPKMRQRYEEFKQGRTKGLAALGGNKDYYERTVGENKRRAAARRHVSQQQQQQNRPQKPTQPGYTPII